MSISICSQSGEILTITSDKIKFGDNQVIHFSNIDKIELSAVAVSIFTNYYVTKSFEYKFEDSELVDYFIECVVEKNSGAEIVYTDEYRETVEKVKALKEASVEKRAEYEEELRKDIVAAIKTGAEEKARKEAEEKTRKEAEEKARKEAEEKVKRNREGIKENAVATNSKQLAKHFEKWADLAYKLITILAIIESIIAIIVGFVLMVDGGFGIFAIFLGSAVVWLFLNFIEAIFIRFILKCVAQNYYAQAEVVQNTYISANVALYSANNTEE